MFDHSPLYTTLQGSARGLREAMQQVFVTDFIAHLNPHDRFTGPELLVHLGEAKGYSVAMHYANSLMDMYNILSEVDDLFQSREHFRKAVEDGLNELYGDDEKQEMLLQIKLVKHKKGHIGHMELMTFEYVSTAGWGD